MCHPIARRAMRSHTLSLLVVCGLVACVALGAARARAQGNGHAPPHPYLRHFNHRLHGRQSIIPGNNGTLKDRFGEDDDSNAADATLSALCQSYIGGSNPYAPPAPNVDAIAGDLRRKRVGVTVREDADVEARQRDGDIEERHEHDIGLGVREAGETAERGAARAVEAEDPHRTRVGVVGR